MNIDEKTFLTWGHSFDTQHIECVRLDKNVLIFVVDPCVNKAALDEKIVADYNVKFGHLDSSACLCDIFIFSQKEFEVYKIVSSISEVEFGKISIDDCTTEDRTCLVRLTLHPTDGSIVGASRWRMLKSLLETTIENSLAKKETFKHAPLKVSVKLVR